MTVVDTARNVSVGPRFNAVDGLVDLAAGLRNWRVSHLIGLSEIRRRYARSRIGQFWLTITTGLMVLVLGVVWSFLWKVTIAELMPFVAISLVLWNLVSGTLTDASTAFVTTGPIFMNQGMSFSVAIYGLVYRHLLIFLHNLPIVVITSLAFSVHVGPLSLLAIPGFFCLFVSLLWLSYLVAIVCVRFRDLPQVVQSVLLIAFFVTPVMWKPEQLDVEMRHLLTYNPLADLLAIVREPLLGQMPTMAQWIFAIAFALGGLVLVLPLIGYARQRIIYWI